MSAKLPLSFSEIPGVLFRNSGLTLGNFEVTSRKFRAYFQEVQALLFGDCGFAPRKFEVYLQEILGLPRDNSGFTSERLPFYS
jgi:hypothetical protein